MLDALAAIAVVFIIAIGRRMLLVANRYDKTEMQDMIKHMATVIICIGILGGLALIRYYLGGDILV